LCDEVTANLDKETAQKVLQNLRSLHIGLVFVTHSLEVVYQGGQLLKLDRGNLTKLENTPHDERNLQ
jgi:ATP-binding cassette subfamily B protein RaxB